MSTLRKIKAAAAIIDKGLWAQGGFTYEEQRINTRTGRRMIKSNPVTCFCAAGALREGANREGASRAFGLSDYGDAVKIFLKAIRKPHGSEEDIWNWNDNKRRTFAQVRNAFKRAVKIAEREAKAA